MARPGFAGLWEEIVSPAEVKGAATQSGPSSRWGPPGGAVRVVSALHGSCIPSGPPGTRQDDAGPRAAPCRSLSTKSCWHRKGPPMLRRRTIAPGAQDKVIEMVDHGDVRKRSTVGVKEALT
jgi:hypothetical protein